MKKSRFTDEQIVAMVQESEASSVAEVARKHQVTEQTVYTWRRRFGGMDKSQVTDYKRLEQENARLKKLLAERDLEIEVMKEINAKKW
jgi:putative transposase